MQRVDCVLLLSLFYFDASVDEVQERCGASRTRSAPSLTCWAQAARNNPCIRPFIRISKTLSRTKSKNINAISKINTNDTQDPYNIASYRIK